mmetsp:Transcript_31939/g.53409  ORF Transcript_31939/g.53409 Transcript_31939/m.53409 type:complete len:262 (+) Transcript_31939:62-847(+)
MVATTPWSDYSSNNISCPISPTTGTASGGAPSISRSLVGVSLLSSPSRSGISANSDNNYYSSPGISPGDWNVPSPSSLSSPQSNASWNSLDSSMNGSPNSAPAAMTSSPPSISSNKPPNLPSELGSNKGCRLTDAERRIAMEKTNKRFLLKSQIDREREQNAIRRANAMMKEATRNQKPEKKLLKTSKGPRCRADIVRDGREHLATSTWSKKTTNSDKKTSPSDTEFEENVDDYKCHLDREREKWAQKQALSLVKFAKSLV